MGSTADVNNESFREQFILQAGYSSIVSLHVSTERTRVVIRKSQELGLIVVQSKVK